MTILANSLVIFFISIGVLFIVVTAIGLVRLPDLYTRAHAASKSATLGVMCVLIGVFFHFWLIEDHFNPRILLGILFLFITGPVGGHIMTRSSYIAGVKPWKGTIHDELGPEIDRMKKEQGIK
ncbi:cation:proton antiporter [Lysinibacillus sphaericus]|uniref:monovalent cation/H(+) antiporter subunit G n=1 Tax=Lysinibacillus TaxID=400634 RepID=UPI0009A90C15|nr:MULTISPECIES: monovalent cation/H(+) antiporter subunit G [Lysinibacillus]MBG9456302.1 cation:proton antiporter [Lysinibacillus sphaericus]MBG9479285.1 cation:proton antiporter [Lysinibacillus sphaericus]MBG9594530.1 cation:proton antiporter [Lysinibacillus sphaericus]MEB2300308.1 monovalent cation/H(+) antiporter subunit G [Lysinibacillus xylanilyticus]OXS74141.1 Na+/H+ antiporter subunit G [Lysinibacillus sp. KCTC 33748]